MKRFIVSVIALTFCVGLGYGHYVFFLETGEEITSSAVLAGSLFFSFLLLTTFGQRLKNLFMSLVVQAMEKKPKAICLLIQDTDGRLAMTEWKIWSETMAIFQFWKPELGRFLRAAGMQQDTQLDLASIKTHEDAIFWGFDKNFDYYVVQVTLLKGGDKVEQVFPEKVKLVDASGSWEALVPPKPIFGLPKHSESPS